MQLLYTGPSTSGVDIPHAGGVIHAHPGELFDVDDDLGVRLLEQDTFALPARKARKPRAAAAKKAVAKKAAAPKSAPIEPAVAPGKE